MHTGGIKFIVAVVFFNELEKLIDENINRFALYNKYATGQNKEIFDEVLGSIGHIKNKFEEMVKLSETRDDG